MCLLSHYRKQLVFSYSSLDGAENAYKKLKSKVLSLNLDGEVDMEAFKKCQDEFKTIISDDLNTANAITYLYDILKMDLNDHTKYEIIKDFDKVLSLDLTKDEQKNVDEEFIKTKIEERNNAKVNKDYETADKIRNELLEMGIVLKDTREGTIYEVK